MTTFEQWLESETRKGNTTPTANDAWDYQQEIINELTEEAKHTNYIKHKLKNAESKCTYLENDIQQLNETILLVQTNFDQ